MAAPGGIQAEAVECGRVIADPVVVVDKIGLGVFAVVDDVQGPVDLPRDGEFYPINKSAQSTCQAWPSGWR